MIHGIGIVFVLGTFIVIMTGCAAIKRSPEVRQEVRPDRLGYVELDTRQEIERELSTVQTDKVLVPTEVLKSLVKDGRSLEAIKDVDLQQSEKNL